MLKILMTATAATALLAGSAVAQQTMSPSSPAQTPRVESVQPQMSGGKFVTAQGATYTCTLVSAANNAGGLAATPAPSVNKGGG